MQKKSKDNFSDVHNNFNSGMFKTSVNRSYYAVLHSARSLLILKGIDLYKHDVVKTMLSLHFVKTGLLPKNIIEIFKELFVLRTDVDYGDLEFIDREEAEKALEKSRTFLETI